MIQFLAPTLLLVIVSYLFYKSFAKSNINLPPGSFGWPLIGETISLLRACREGVPERFVLERIKKHGRPPVFKTSLYGDRMAVLCGPAGNKFLFANEFKLVSAWWPVQVWKLFGKCILTIRGDEAKYMRKIMLSYLGPDAFANHYIATMDVVARSHIQNHWQGKEEVNVYKTVKSFAFEVACRLFTSLDEPNEMAKLFTHFTTILKGIIEFPLDFPGTIFYSSKKASMEIKKQLVTIIQNRRAEIKQGTSSSNQDLLSHLIVSLDENGRPYPDMEIASNILVLLFAGHDTSAVTITLLMRILVQHPDVYDKVLREQLKISEAKAAGELLNWDDIKKMRYSQNVVSEVMRLNPPVFGAFREVLEDFEYEGYTIPKGWKIFLNIGLTHKDEEIFEDVERFDPSRFEDIGPNRFTYLPFGGGPRICLGKEFARLEILVFLHNIIPKFKWDMLIPNEKIIYGPLATPVKGLWVHLHPHQA